MAKKKKAYARAGVDVDLGNQLKRRIQSLVRQTHGPQVLGKIGGFGGLFRARFSQMRDPILVSSIDSVGTKLKIAFALDRHNTVGADMVNHCVNDIAVVGARPLFFLDYIGCEKLEPRVFDQLLRGFSRACRAAGGGLIDNLPRVLPKNCDAVIETKSWRAPRIFQVLQEHGNVSRSEMYQVFNMGIGMVAIVAERDAKRAMSILRAKRIGRIERGR